MRIAVIDPSLFTLPYDAALIGGLSQGGHHVSLHGRALRVEDGGPGAVDLQKDFYRLAGSSLAASMPPAIRLAVKGLDHIWSMTRLLRRLRRAPRPDVIHFQWLPLPMIDGRFLKSLQSIAPIVLTVHDTNPFNGDPSAALQGRGFRRCLDQFNALIVHTEQGRNRLHAMGIPLGKIRVLPHGMLAAAVPGSASAMSGKLNFLLFGKVKPYKGADLLIKAFATLPAGLRDQATLRIVGKPYMDMAPLHALAQSCHGRVSFELGFVADDAVPALFGPDTIAVFPYREIEASGVLFVALAHGRPIIASRLGTFADLLTDGEQGLLVEPGDVAGLAAAMSAMIDDRAFAARCSAGAYRTATDIPSWAEIGRRTTGVYRAAAADWSRSLAHPLSVIECG